MNKQAYLIMAHDDFELLKILLKLIDAKYNDIYLHIDAKANVDVEMMHSWVVESTLHIVKRMDVCWGGYSQIECEVCLLKEAIKTKHSYYHLLSGHDLPIKNKEYIYNFFECNAGVEYIAYNRLEIRDEVLNDLMMYTGIFKKKSVERISKRIQTILGINRGKKYDLTYMKGANWFSITHELAQYVVSNAKLIKKLFCFTRNGDEVFIQTLAYNSKFKERLNTDYNDIQYRILESQNTMANFRTMDWPDELGTSHPKILTMKDLPALQVSGAFWARKFDTKIDAQVIDEIYNLLTIQRHDFV